MSEEKANGVPETPSPKGTDQIEGKEGRRGESSRSPKTSQSTLLKCRLDYEAGQWKSLRELSDRHGINEKTLAGRVLREKWNVHRQAIISKVEKKVELEVDSYLKRSYLRSQRYEKLIDASLSQLATTPEGIPLCEPSDIDSLSRSEMRIAELSRIALRIPVLSSLDITSGGQDLGTSFVQAIAKLRANPEKLEAADLSRVLEAEVE